MKCWICGEERDFLSLNGLCLKCETEVYGTEAMQATKRRFKNLDGGFEHYDTTKAIEHPAQSPEGVLSLYLELPDGRWVMEGWYGAREVRESELPGELAALIPARRDSTPTDPPDDQADVWISFAEASKMTGLEFYQITRACDSGNIRFQGDHRGRKVHLVDLKRFIFERSKNGGN
jgi:hypothetical protein